jgi:AcrR family transcriptional regulator
MNPSIRSTGQRRRQLSLDRLVRSVIEIGFDHLSVQRVAEHLHVSTSALYKHVDSIDTLVMLVVDRLFAQMPPVDGAGGLDELAREARQRYQLEKRHRGLYAAWRAAGRWSDAEINRRETLIAALLSAGLDIADAITATQSTLSVAHEEAEQNTQLGAWDAHPADSPPLAAYIAQFSPDIAAALTSLSSDADRYFARRLEITLAGVQALMTTPPGFTRSVPNANPGGVS